MTTNTQDLIARLEGPSNVLSGIALAVFSIWLLTHFAEGRAIIIPSWVGFFGFLLLATAFLKFVNGLLTIRLRQLRKRAALLRAEGE